MGLEPRSNIEDTRIDLSLGKWPLKGFRNNPQQHQESPQRIRHHGVI